MFDPGWSYAWDYILSKVPDAMSETLQFMAPREKTEFILSGFNCGYVNEWDDIYMMLMMYCVQKYEQRQKLILDT